MRALIFDLDGTLIDTVYAHTVAWHRALGDDGLNVDARLVHASIGKTGDLLLDAVAHELEIKIDPERAKKLKAAHKSYFDSFAPDRRPLNGAVELLQELRRRRIRFGIATSSEAAECAASLAALQLGDDTIVVKHGDVEASKPNPDMFQVCRKRLDVPAADCFIVGDAVWDLLAAKRAGMLAVGLTSGGIGADQLRAAGAYRVYDGPQAMLDNLADFGLESTA